MGLRPAPEFDDWLQEMLVADKDSRLLPILPQHVLIESAKSRTD
jgi:hypothetical protein